MRTISAADANRYFSKLMRDVQAGETVTITSRGKPVARIEPAGREVANSDEGARQKDWEAFIAELRAKPALNLGKITRDEIYDDN